MELTQNKLLIIDPYNEKHLELVKQFEYELDNHLPYQVSDILCNIRISQPKEMYEEKKKSKDTIEENLYLVHNRKLVSSCFIEGSKKNKTCTFSYLTLPKYRNQGFASQLLCLAFDYVSNFFGIETVELDVPHTNEESIRVAEKAGFILVDDRGVQKTYQKSIANKIEEVKKL